jgi:hypothetical protein
MMVIYRGIKTGPACPGMKPGIRLKKLIIAACTPVHTYTGMIIVFTGERKFSPFHTGYLVLLGCQ